MAEQDKLSPEQRLALTVETALRIPELREQPADERPLPAFIYRQMEDDREDRIELIMSMLQRDAAKIARKSKARVVDVDSLRAKLRDEGEKAASRVSDARKARQRSINAQIRALRAELTKEFAR